MMDAETLKAMNRERATKAARFKKVPFLVEEENIKGFRREWETGTLSFPFPNLGDYRPDGYELVNTHFAASQSPGSGVDTTSGQIEVGELAMTIPEFLDHLVPGRHYALIDEGQFQVHVGEFTREQT